MLEFQEGFFEQEVRDGFYLDVTMKTLWAAELEVLQKVAEICDRHGLKWYVGCGTLLGAIRHEGFVPWDDDMDIWVKRPDYNILMQVLPKELPEGYLVRSPMTDEGYEQFHTCLNNGNGISIAKDWLEQYHGCPFTVGLDIFPLDYLPRDEKEKNLQAQLLAMTGRIAQLAKNISRGQYDLEEDEDKESEKQDKEIKRKGRKKKKKSEKERVIEEIKLGIDYLEEKCKLEIDHQLLEDGNWSKVSSELWKWANYIAMMYEEDESDYIAEIYDYIQCPHKVYPKEWFADGYSAKFENFMIPVPAGYHRILQFIYGLSGNYFVRMKKTGRHEYPFYARQLRQLREYVKNVQQRAQDFGLVAIDEIEVKEESKELLPEWLPLTVKADGSKKKVVLSANDPAVYTVHGEKALKKLEEMLHTFEQVKDSILLWWRPQPVMKQILDQTSLELGERYQEILDRYKESGWGICDETDNIDRAVAACDIYYGDMNAILQPFQNAGKAIILSVIEDGEAWKKNAERINEYRIFLSMSDFVEDDRRIYFANTNYNTLIVADKETGKIDKSVPLAGYQVDMKNMHLQCARLQNKIYFLPAAAQCLHIYNMDNGEQKVCDFLKQVEDETVRQESWGYFVQGDLIYLLPCHSSHGLWSIAAQEDTPLSETWWEISSDDIFPLRHGTMDEERFYTYAVNTNKLYITNVSDQTVESILLPDKNVQHVTYDGQNFWYTIKSASDIVCWNVEQGVVDRFKVSYDIYYVIGSWYHMETYAGICYAGGHLFLLSAEGTTLYVLDQEKRALQVLHDFECARGAFFSKEIPVYFKCKGNTLVCMLQNVGEMLVIDLETLTVRQVVESFCADSPVKEAVYEQSYKLLLGRKALLFEERGKADLKLLLQYCMEW